LKTIVVESTEAGENTVTLNFGGTSLIIGTAYLPPEFSRSSLCAGSCIGPELYPVLEQAAECWKAEKAALALIARAEQCSWNLCRKLEKKKITSEIIHIVVPRLLDLNLVNDRRFAELWLKTRIKGGTKGPRTLRLLLRARGIDRITADAALAASLTAEDETALLRRCLDKAEGRKICPGKGGKNSADQKTAIRFFLKQEGFSAEIINRYLEAQINP
jgi:regulatory protein